MTSRADRHRSLHPDRAGRRLAGLLRPGRQAAGPSWTAGSPPSSPRPSPTWRPCSQGEGASLASVVKTTVFLTDMADFAVMNKAYVAAFGDHRPARSAVAVVALPLGAAVEIEAWAAGSGSLG